jgi:predicted helicase
LFELITYYIFKLGPRLNNNIQDIWMYKDMPNNILKELELPKNNKGTDILIEKNGEYHEIQCKFRQNH